MRDDNDHVATQSSVVGRTIAFVNTAPLCARQLNMNRRGRWLWWMDKDDPRFRDSAWAKTGFVIVWAIGFLVMLLVSQCVVSLLVGLGVMARAGP
jgi:hypothetical protein